METPLRVHAESKQIGLGLVSPCQTDRFEPRRFPGAAFGKLLLDSAGNSMNGLNERPGVDAGWRFPLAFQGSWPRAAQAGC